MSKPERSQEAQAEGRPQTFAGAEPQEFQDAGYRLSPQQRLVWQRSGAGGAHAYCAQCVVEIDGPLQAGTLKQALELVRARHEILRTSFRRRVGMRLPLQVIGEEAAGEGWWGIVEAAASPGPEQERALEEFCREERARDFDLARGEVLRARLLEFHGGRRALVLTLPSLCADARTLDNIVRELTLACDAVAGGPPPGAEVVQYVQFSEWQNELQEAEWAEPRGTSPRADGSRHEAPSAFDPEHLSTLLGPDAAAQAEALAREFQCGVDVLLLACLQSLLWRLTGRSEVSVNAVFDGRVFEDLEGVAGLLAMPLPVECRFREDSRFEEVLGQVNEAVLATRAQQEQSSLMPAAPAQGEAAGPPVEFEFNDLTRQYTTARGARFTLAELNVCLNRYSLKLSAELRRGSLDLRWFYDASRHTRREVELLAGRFARLLSAVGRGGLVSGLPVLPEEERRRLLEEWNDTRAEFPHDCMHRLFEEQAARTPEATAVTYEGERLSYVELNLRANQLAHFLRGAGVGPEVTVGVLTERTPAMAVSILSVLKAGGAYVPLDPSYPVERLRFMLEDSAVSVLLTEESLKELLPGQAAKVVCVDSEWEEIARGGGEGEVNPVTGVTPHNLAYVIYTSGSTGRPKGVMVEHAGLVNYLCWAASAYPVAEGAPVHSPLAFDLTVTSLLAPLVRGGAVELLAGGVGASRLWEALGGRSRPYGVVKLTPSHLRALRATEGAASALVVGGEALRWGDIRGWLAAGARVFNEYGPTEAVVGCVFYEAAASEAAPERDEEPVPIGRPIANARIYVLDTSLAPEPEGVAGEIYIAGAGLARGYLKRAGLTAESFLPDPFAGAGERMYRTGDVGRWMEGGTLEYLGRTDSQVKVRGYRIELGEIEAALLSHASVKDAAVLARDGDGGDKRLVAYVAADEGAAPGAQELREHLLKSLPDYMVPAQFVVLAALPLTENGKADRRALAALSEGRARGAAGAYVAPRTEVEEKLAAIWSEVLGAERVGIHDNFFDLGGDSILGVQIISRAMDAGIRLIPRQMFQHQTVAELAEAAGVSDGADDLAVELAALLPDLSPEASGASSPDGPAEMSFDPAELEKILGKVKFGD